ncbi:AAA family ATPase [Metapseudomonas otitidis]|uniref:AAA family ATPase n=1 Tax=Metapseudomonas otitidis TaxID=319939 RepID=UPI0026215A92|nr:AAA family ATPase [Pseudomonas otitidis]
MSHYGISNQKTTAGNFASKAAYFEKKLKELRALQEKRISLGMSREASSEELAAELARVDAEIAKIASRVEGEWGTGGDDYYHKSGNDTLASGIVGPLASKLGLGEHPQDGDYLALFRGINPRTKEAFLGDRRLKQIDKAIQKAEERKSNPSAKKKLDASDLDQLVKDAKEKSANDPVLGFSSCVSLQKSISVYWAQADDQTRKLIQECMMGAVNDAIDREHKVGRIRGKEGAQGAESVEGECVTLTYAHCTARRVQGEEFPDPQLHVHLERPNFVRTKDGKYLSIHAGWLYKSQREFGAVVDIAFYQRLQKRLPELASAMVVDYTGHGLRLNESSVPKDIVVEKSKRRGQIQEEKQNLATSGQGAAQAIALRTRDGKDVALGENLDAHWRSTIPPIELKASTAEELKGPSLNQVRRLIFRGNTVIDEFAIDAAAASLTIGRGGFDDIAATKSAIFKQLGIIEIPQEPDDEGRTPPKRFTTKGLIRLEVDCLKAVYSGLDDPRWTVDRAFVDSMIDAYEKEKQSKQKPGAKPFKLTDEQRQAVYDLTQKGQFCFLKGAAGVGKSASLAPAFRIYKAIFKNNGRRIIGVAPGNKQHSELGKSTGIATQTVHSLLIKHQAAMAAKASGQRYKPEHLINSGDIVVCDEAGMLDTYLMHHLVVACHQAGARLICVGDRNQHGAVETAALFGLLHTAVGDRCAKIETIARQVEQYKPTAQALYQGKTKLALDYMLRDEQLRVFADGVNEADELVGDLFDDMKAGLPGEDNVVRELDWKDVLVLADTNNQVRALNDKIRDGRFARGQLSADGSVSIETEVLPGQRFTIQVAIGERLLLRKNAKDADSQQIYNGDLGTVTGIERITRAIDGEVIEDIQFTIIRDDGKNVKINASEYQSLQYAYSMTGHKAQGMTVARAYAIDPISLESLYVNYTRGIYGAKIYLNSANWTEFVKNVEKFKPKENALELMPNLQASIRATAQSGVMAPLKAQETSVIDMVTDTSSLFEFPTLSNAPQQPAAAESEKPEQSVTVIPPVEAEIEHAKAFGAAIVDLRSDEQAWPADARRVAVVAAENPAPGVEVEPWKNPGSSVPAEQRRDICETLQGMTPALTTTKYRYIKPVPQEANHERLAAADSRRGTEYQPGRADDRRDAEPARISTGFGIRKPISRGLAKLQPAPVFTPESADYQLSYVRAAAGRRPPENVLQRLSARSLAENRERNQGVLQGNVFLAGRAVPELRRPVPAAKGLVVNRFDKKADARDIQDAKREVDLIKFAGELGYKVDDKKTKVKYSPDQILNGEAAVMVNGASQIDVFKGKNGEWAWYDRKAAEGGDIFKLYQHENPTASFVQAKEAVLGDLIPLSDSDRAERKRLAAVKEKEKQEKREADIKAGTQEAQRTFGLMSRGSASYLESRGISPEVLAATRWKTNIYGSACFPHYDADRNFSGYEYRGFDYKDKATGEKRQAKGFSSNTEKGIYIANRDCANPTEIRFSEGGVDVLSAYQLATSEERQRILFVGTTGEPGSKTEAAIIALAERHNISRFSLAYDRDQGGDSLTAKRTARLAERFPDAQIEDVRERIGLQIGEDPNQLVQRLQGMTAEPAEIMATPVQAEQPPAAATPTQATEPEHTAEHEAEIRPGPRRF